MEKEPRKASEIILSMENKIDTLLGIVRSLDLNIKILSNKLNQLSEKREHAPPKITMEAVNTSSIARTSTMNSIIDPEKNILIDPEKSLQLEDAPKGFRRTSRPETFAGDNSYLPRAKELPKSEVVVPDRNNAPIQSKTNVPQSNINSPVVIIPTMQRVVNRNNKSIFLADVEITNLETKEVKRIRTNGTGKWTAPLQTGSYRVVVKKQEAASSEALEVVQDIKIDGKTSPLELSILIIK